VYKLKASIDFKIIEVYILSQNIKEIKDLHMKPNFAEVFSDKIIIEFMGNVKIKNVDESLKNKELPLEFYIDKKFILIKEYFSNNKCNLPIMLRKINGETDFTHK